MTKWNHSKLKIMVFMIDMLLTVYNLHVSLNFATIIPVYTSKQVELYWHLLFVGGYRLPTKHKFVYAVSVIPLCCD